MLEVVWKNWAHPNCKLFAWLILQDEIILKKHEWSNCGRLSFAIKKMKPQYIFLSIADTQYVFGIWSSHGYGLLRCTHNLRKIATRSRNGESRLYTPMEGLALAIGDHGQHPWVTAGGGHQHIALSYRHAGKINHEKGQRSSGMEQKEKKRGQGAEQKRQGKKRQIKKRSTRLHRLLFHPESIDSRSPLGLCLRSLAPSPMTAQIASGQSLPLGPCRSSSPFIFDRLLLLLHTA
jgi:hypothetical protein